MNPSVCRFFVRRSFTVSPHLRPACRVVFAKPCSSISSIGSIGSISGDPAAPPSTRQLLLHARLAAVPMVGFGFMDNIIMIQAGDLIDGYFGASLGITTMTAAAMGNVCSDSSGVLFGGVVDTASDALNLERPHFSEEQATMAVTRRAAMAGSLVGVICGCCLGMSTLLFTDADARERLKQSQQLDSAFLMVVENLKELTRSEACTLYLYDAEKRELCSRVTTAVELGRVNSIIRLSIDAAQGLASESARTRQVLNILDAKNDPRHDRRWDSEGFITRQVLCTPIFQSDGKIYGVIQCINKEGDGQFTKDDENLVEMAARHVQIFVACVTEGD